MALAGGKTVSNLALTICSILDVLEEPVLDLHKFSSYSFKIDKMFYDLDRHIRKKIKDEFYQLDFKHFDLVAMADAAKKHLNKLQGKLTFSSMHKYLLGKSPLTQGQFSEWQQEVMLISACVTMLNRIVFIFSYQAILVSVLEGEDEMFKIENVLLNAIKEEIGKSKSAV